MDSLTGLAQVLQPPDTDLNIVRSKLAFDLHYVDHWCLCLDLRILLAMVPHVLSVPPEMIARVFRLPQVSSSSKAELSSPTAVSLVTPQVLPQLSEACNPAG